MAKAKKPKKKEVQQLVSPWTVNWPNFDQMFGDWKKDFERVFTPFPTIPTPSFPKIASTSCDLVDEGSKLVAKIDLPGVKKKDIKLNITENSLEVSAGHKEEAEEKKKNFLRKERSEISYYRTLPLPEKIVPDKVRAKLTDGTLNVSLPKQKPTPKSKKRSISVQ